MSVFFVKVPPKSYFQSITEEPKYQAKALTVVTDTIKTAGAAEVVNIPSDRCKTTGHVKSIVILIMRSPEQHSFKVIKTKTFSKTKT